MMIHIGDNISLFDKDILMILDKNSVKSSKGNLEIINYLIDNGMVENQIEQEVKSYIIVLEKRNKSRDKEKIKLYVSNISSTSLLNRQRV